MSAANVIDAARRFLHSASTPAFTDARGDIIPGSVAALERVRIAGTDQWILARGRDVRSPVLLFLSGGPCASEMSLLRHFDAALEDHFVVVTWDHRGAAKSYGALAAAVPTIDRHVEDARELVEHLCRRFECEKVFLVGHSWGTAPGLEMARRYGHLLHAYVGIEQLVNVGEGRKLAYEQTLRLAQQAGDATAVYTIEAIGPPPYAGRWLQMLKHWTIVRMALRFGHSGEGLRVVHDMAMVSLRAPEYSWIDLANFVRALTSGFMQTFPHLDGLDFERTAPRIDVPVYFMLGRNDVLTPPELAERYIAKLEAPSKRIIWFERAGHLPPYEEPERFVSAMVDEVLREAALPETFPAPAPQ